MFGSPATMSLILLFLACGLLPLVQSRCPEVLRKNICHYVIGKHTEKSPCDLAIINCSTEAAVSVRDSARGQVTFSLPAVSPSCNVTRYHISLRVRSSAADCATPDIEWQTHSRRDVLVDYCEEDDVACTSSSPPCGETPREVKFQYVYSGWYHIRVTPHLGASTRQTQRSKPVQLLTSYSPKTLVNLNSTVSSLQYRDFHNESRVTFHFTEDLEWGEPDRFRVSLSLVSNVNTLLSDGCLESGNEHSCCTITAEGTNGTKMGCTTYGEAFAAPNCTASRQTVQCYYRGIPHGSYCAILSFRDDRCEPETVWTEPDNRPCQWKVFKEFEADPPGASQPSTIVETSSGVVYGIIGAFLIVTIIAAAFILGVRHRAKRREQLPTEATPEAPHQYRFVIEPAGGRHFSLSNQFTLTERPRPEVLLIYCRDSKPFMDLVASLRTVLTKICKCQVYDYFDDNLWNHVMVDPEGWVRELVMEREAKVVIVASRAAAISTGAHAVKYRNPHAFDHLFPYVLKMVKEAARDEIYKNQFIVTFDGYTDNSQLLSHLNPFTRFALPKHLNKLFEHLHHPSATVHFDTSRKLEEREEVRQLRLRLEHLINLNLLSKNEQEQIYDW